MECHSLIKHIHEISKGHCARNYSVSYFVYEGKFISYTDLSKMYELSYGTELLTHRSNDVCFARLVIDFTKGANIISGKFRMDSVLSKGQIREWCRTLKKWNYLNADFGVERFVKTREWIWNIGNMNLQQWYFMLNCLRCVYEKDILIECINYLMEHGMSFPIAFAVAHLEVEHNSVHGVYPKGTWRGGTEITGYDFWGSTTETTTPRWDRKSLSFEKIRQDQDADINQIIKVCIQTRRFLDQERDPISKTGIKRRFEMHKAIYDQKVTRKEYNFGFEYGDYDKLINFNPYERMKNEQSSI